MRFREPQHLGVLVVPSDWLTRREDQRTRLDRVILISHGFITAVLKHGHHRDWREELA